MAKRLNNRFQVGDIISIEKYWDQSDEINKSGIVLITEYTPMYPSTVNGYYEMRTLKGSFNSFRYASDFFDKLPYLVLLGNINDPDVSPALKILYGSR